MSRTAFKDNTSYYQLNGKKVPFKEVAVLLRKSGIDLDHNRFLILQVSYVPCVGATLPLYSHYSLVLCWGNLPVDHHYRKVYTGMLSRHTSQPTPQHRLIVVTL